MSEIDDKILEALTGEDREALESFTAQPGFFSMLWEPMRGSFKSIAIAAFVVMIVVFVMLVYSIVGFFSATDEVSKLHWTGIGLAMLIVMGLLRIWYFMEINRLSVIREIKRLELQVSLMAKKLDRS